MEFILVFAFSLLLVLPFIHMLSTQYMEKKVQLDESQAREVLDAIEVATENVYHSGYPTRTTLELYFPAGIDSIEAVFVPSDELNQSELIFYTVRGNTEGQLVSSFAFHVNATLKPTRGKRIILIKAEKAHYVNITDSPT